MYLYLGKTCLMYAAKRGNTDTVKILLEHGADVNNKDKDGQLDNFLKLNIYVPKHLIVRAFNIYFYFTYVHILNWQH